MPEVFNASAYLLDRQLAAGHGRSVAVTGPGAGDRAITYTELGEQVGRAAAGWRALGVRAEERVMFVCSDRLELLVGLLAAMRIGAVPVPVSTMYNPEELTVLLHDSRARALVVSPEFAGAADVALAGSEVELLVAVGDAACATPAGGVLVSWADLLGAGESGAAATSCYPTWADSPAFWLYTSGTTGTPKAAMHRHGSVAAVADGYGRQVLGITASDRCFSVAKLFFAYGLGNSAFFPLSVGAASVLDPARPTPASVARRVAEQRPTLFFAVPSFYAALLAAGPDPADFASVRLAVSAGEALPPELYRRFLDRFGVQIIDGIGSTEALHIFLSNRPGQVRPGTSGTPVPGYEVRVLDETGAAAPPGRPGDLMVRGPSLTTGYWCRTALTRAAFAGDWLRTGDTYTVSDDGWYTCLGRSNDMIKSGGIWVSPAEVEQCLIEHPSVAAVAVVAVPDADGLDRTVACVVPAEGHEVDGPVLIEHCRTRLAAFKRPRHVLAVAEIPTTATGKLRRFAIREQAARRLAEA